MNLSLIGRYKVLQQKREETLFKIKNSRTLADKGMRLPKCTGERWLFFNKNKELIYRCSLQGTNELHYIEEEIAEIEQLEKPTVYIFTEDDMNRFLVEFNEFFEEGF